MFLHRLSQDVEIGVVSLSGHNANSPRMYRSVDICEFYILWRFETFQVQFPLHDGDRLNGHIPSL